MTTEISKPWTAEQEADAFRWIELERASDPKAPFVYARLQKKFGKEVWEAVSDFVDSQTAPTPPDDDEPETSTAEHEPKATDGTIDGMPALLPFSKLPGYLVDAWGIPYRAKTQGRKAGKVKLENYLFQRKGRKGVEHAARYRLTVGGKQKTFYPRYLMRARIHAEAEWRKQRES